MGITDCRKEELQHVDIKIRKLLTTYRALHPQAHDDRFYIKRAKGGGGMLSIEDCVNGETNSLSKYITISRIVRRQ